jgi:hypothetical protein
MQHCLSHPGEIPQLCGLAAILGVMDCWPMISYPSRCEVLLFDLQSARGVALHWRILRCWLSGRRPSSGDELPIFSINRRVFHIGTQREAGPPDDCVCSPPESAWPADRHRATTFRKTIGCTGPITELGSKRAALVGGCIRISCQPVCRAIPTRSAERLCVAVEQPDVSGSEKGIPGASLNQVTIIRFRADLSIQALAFRNWDTNVDWRITWWSRLCALLALSFAPQKCYEFGWFENHKMWALYGLYESVDFA